MSEQKRKRLKQSLEFMVDNLDNTPYNKGQKGVFRHIIKDITTMDINKLSNCIDVMQNNRKHELNGVRQELDHAKKNSIDDVEKNNE